MRILLVDDEDVVRIPLTDDIREAGYEVTPFASPIEAIEHLETNDDIALVVTDWKMPGMDGMEFLRRAKQIDPNVLVVLMTAYGTVQTAVNAVKQGAYDYLLKPFESEDLLLIIDRGMRFRLAIEDKRRLAEELDRKSRFDRLVGQSAPMLRVFELLGIAAESNSTVLITGETGTGKELAAEAIHNASARKQRPLIRVSCAALSKEILESELFGHEKGAFTGAIRDRIGRFERAQGGSIYLDDVDDIPLDVQVKLLRVLQERILERVGGTTPVNLDVRVIASTKADLRDAVRNGTFRQDLYYRLNVLPIRLPALREKPDDIPLLARHFLEKHGDSKRLNISVEALEALMSYSWPGNARELEHLIERLLLTTRTETIGYRDIPEEILCPDLREGCPNLGRKSLDTIVEETTRNIIRAALARTEGNKAKAAELLQVPASTLRSRMEKLDIV